MICRIIQHVLFEDLGTFEEVLRKRGYELHFHQAGVNLPSKEEWSSADLCIIMGGPIGVEDAEKYPFIPSELDLIKDRWHKGGAMLGICLGAQLLAKAMGGKVYPNTVKEIGWSALTLSQEGYNSPLRYLNGPVLHWHGDTFDLPKGVELLASTEITRNQAFRAGPKILALQFHPEVDTARFEQWLIGHTTELGAAKVDPRILRKDAKKYGITLKKRGALLFKEWLDNL